MGCEKKIFFRTRSERSDLEEKINKKMIHYPGSIDRSAWSVVMLYVFLCTRLAVGLGQRDFDDFDVLIWLFVMIEKHCEADGASHQYAAPRADIFSPSARGANGANTQWL